VKFAESYVVMWKG